MNRLRFYFFLLLKVKKRTKMCTSHEAAPPCLLLFSSSTSNHHVSLHVLLFGFWQWPFSVRVTLESGNDRRRIRCDSYGNDNKRNSTVLAMVARGQLDSHHPGSGTPPMILRHRRRTRRPMAATLHPQRPTRNSSPLFFFNVFKRLNSAVCIYWML